MPIKLRSPRYGLANHGIGAAPKLEACVRICGMRIHQNICKGKTFKGYQGEAKVTTPKRYGNKASAAANDINMKLMILYAIIQEAGLQVACQ
jgi:hypothetical protein